MENQKPIRHLLGISDGKDSAALAVYIHDLKAKKIIKLRYKKGMCLKALVMLETFCQVWADELPTLVI